MKIAIYGSSLLSAYWNGAATYYRGIVRALAAHGHEITFFEPDAYDRQSHRDIAPPSWCRVVVYPATRDAMQAALAQSRGADIVIKASGVGVFDDELLQGIFRTGRPATRRLFWDVDAPATLAEIAASPEHPLRRALPALDAVLTYGGGDPVVDAYRTLGARLCVPIYNALDPRTHHPVPAQARFAADLGFLGNRLPDRERRVEEFLFKPAARSPGHRFLLGGAGWEDKPCPENVVRLGHVPTDAHNAFNASARAVLNVSRDSMAATGFSPATRVFEAAGAAACLLTDAWDGIELFLKPDDEVLVVRDGQDVADALAALTEARARTIGAAALRRVLAEHTYDRRAARLDGLLRRLAATHPAESMSNEAGV
jgi:spore maturation protein CgeB